MSELKAWNIKKQNGSRQECSIGFKNFLIRFSMNQQIQKNDLKLVFSLQPKFH